MKSNFENAEQLMNYRLDIILNLGETPADRAFLNGAAQMVKALGFDFIRRGDKFEIFAPESTDDDKAPMNELLADVYKFLYAYQFVNRDYLAESDKYDLARAIATVKTLQRHSSELDLVTRND